LRMPIRDIHIRDISDMPLTSGHRDIMMS
jgi:hypothetical protein